MASDLEYSYFRRSQRRKLIALVLLLMLLASIAYAGYYFSQNRRLPIPGASTEAQIQPPNFLFAITGQGPSGMPKPTGVAVSKDKRVFVSVPSLSVIRVFDAEGKFLFSFNAIEDGEKKALDNPVHIAMSPKGELYVADRDHGSIYVFALDGTFLRKFMPEGGEPKWTPLAITFDREGYLYVSDVRDTDRHRVFVFDPNGKKVSEFGRTRQADKMSEEPGSFFFPNGFAVDDSGQVYVADGNNRRVQVFDRKGEFKRFLKTSGVPRGLVTDEKSRVYVVDALGHVVDIYTPAGESLATFGGAGFGPGQFQFPNDIATDREGRLYVVDRDNNQVQVWGWPKAPIPVPTIPAEPKQWAWCLLPLLLMALPALLRRRKVVVMPDFVNAMVAAEDVALMQARRWKWLMPEAEYPAFEGVSAQGVDLGRLLEPAVHSVSEMNDLRDRLHIEEREAIALSIARQTKALLTEDEELRRLATLLGVDVYNRAEFTQRYSKRS